MNSKTQNIGWNFDNSYAKLPSSFFTKLDPIPVKEPELVVLNKALASELGLELDGVSDEQLAQCFSGNMLPEGAESIAQAYAGHQFGNFAILGDGRAHIIGEHIIPSKKRFDIQFKGSGQTPYSRRGDGRATLGPMLREYIISEAMYALGIPTTRSLAVVTTGEPVMREDLLPGAILTRVATSHIRVGTFEYIAHQGNKEDLKKLADYAIERHYPEILGSEQIYQDFLASVMDRQIELITEWLRVGFIHGVMNTDNMTISGETIDYGPCAFMDRYNPNTVFSSIDEGGRYAYANQPHIGQWNLARFAESILPLIDTDINKAAEIAAEIINSYNEKFQKQWLGMMRYKLGLIGREEGDEKLIGELLQWMQKNEADYTNTFRDLCSEDCPDADIYKNEDFKAWYKNWQQRLLKHQDNIVESLQIMKTSNPAFIPRNHLVEEALEAAVVRNDFSVLHELLKVLKQPYEDDSKYKEFRKLPNSGAQIYQTFCGT